MITLEKVDGATLEAEAEKAGITLPIEQTKVWSGFRRISTDAHHGAII